MNDKPFIFSNKKKSTKKDSVADPRFTDKPSTSRHIKNYAFLYSKDMLKTLRKREERSRLENELVKSGKKKFYMTKKQMQKLEESKD